jgi:DNA helicase II / ATP-dependent DNA helicase PcrA
VTRSSDLLRGLDRDQRDAITTDDAPLAIVAAAGSGKTTVLTRRIARRIRDGSADPAHIVAVTFTREAAVELRRRLRRLDIRTRIEAGTFHAICLHLLRDHALARNLPSPQVATDRLRLLRELAGSDTTPGSRRRSGSAQRTVSELDVRGVQADIDWARARLIDANDYDYACLRAGRRSTIQPGTYGTTIAGYTQLKRRRGVVDFDDLLERTIELMASDRQFGDLVRWRFRHIFVDEAQDLNPLQARLLDSWRSGRADMCLVGDPRQAIYGFNGSDPDMLGDVDKLLPGVRVARLTTNYRCTPQVVTAAAGALTHAQMVDDTRSGLPDGPDVAWHEAGDEAAEATWVADQVISAMVHLAPNHIAVLARTNDQLEAIERALHRHGVPTTRAVGQSTVDRIVSEASRAGSDGIGAWIDAAAASESAVRRRVALEADRFVALGAPGRFAAWVDQTGALDDWNDDPFDAVTVTTMHAAKGREWHTVFVTGCEPGLLPHHSAVTDAQRNEEARLLYVAATRAAQRLVLTWAARRRDRTAGRTSLLDGVVDDNHGSGQADDAVQSAMHAALQVLGNRRDPVDSWPAFVAWRAGIARAGGMEPSAVCTDRVLRDLMQRPPVDNADFAHRLGLTETAAARLAPLPK